MDRCSRLAKSGLHPQPLFIVEAELDALLLWQKAGDLVDVAALDTNQGRGVERHAAGGVVGVGDGSDR